VAVRWYLRYRLSYRDVEELLVERGVEVDHVTAYRWVQRLTPLFADVARHAPGDRWFVDERECQLKDLRNRRVTFQSSTLSLDRRPATIPGSTPIRLANAVISGPQPHHPKVDRVVARSRAGLFE
jgi:hypothetical protein